MPKTRDLVFGTGNQLDLIAYENKKEKENNFYAISNTCWNWKHTLKKCNFMFNLLALHFEIIITHFYFILNHLLLLEKCSNSPLSTFFTYTLSKIRKHHIIFNSDILFHFPFFQFI